MVKKKELKEKVATVETEEAAPQDKPAKLATKSFKITVPQEWARILEQHIRCFNVGRHVEMTIEVMTE